MKLLNQLILASVLGISALPAVSHAEGQFYLKPYIGLSALSDQNAQTNGIGSRDGTVELSLNSGFVSGLGFGYRYSKNIAAEIAWEYRTNDSEATLADGTSFRDGNYASNILYLNGYYFLETSGNWTPYVGAGLGWVQEIDLDFEDGDTEQSYSGDNELAMQLMAGVEYSINERISLNAEARYSTTSADLAGEDNTGSIVDLDYTPLSLQLGLSFYF